MDNWTSEGAAQLTAASEEAIRAGERYLQARYRHEAAEAGLCVDPSVWVDPDVEPRGIPGGQFDIFPGMQPD